MKIFQLKSGYRYNSDTLFLWDFAREILAKFQNVKILDVGSGSGILGLLLKRDFANFEISLLEIQNENFEILKKNVAENSLDCEILMQDFAHFKSETKFDFIVSNPPYYLANIQNSENEHKKISKFALNLSLREFISSASLNLKQNGSLIFCYDAKQIQQICVVLNEFKFKIAKLKFCHAKDGKNANIVLIFARKNSKTLAEILTPNFMFENEIYSENAEKIFKKADLISYDL